jgi:hypothetical protein
MCVASSGRQIKKRKSLLKWLANIQTSQTTINGKIVIEIITIPAAGAEVLATAITIAEDAAEVEESAVVAAGEPRIVSINRMLNALIVAKKVTTPLSVPSRKKNNERSNMVSKADFKNLFQSSLKDMLTEKDKKEKNNAEGDDDFLDMNVFQKLMEGKHQMFVNENNDDLISINDTDNLDYSIQDKITHAISEHNNYNNDYDESAYPFSKRIKLKHEPEKAHENVPVKYTADIIVEIKNRDCTVVYHIKIICG